MKKKVYNIINTVAIAQVLEATFENWKIFGRVTECVYISEYNKYKNRN